MKFTWDAEDFKYTNSTPFPRPPEYDIAEIGDGTKQPTPPQVHPLGRCADGKCTPAAEEGISVNGKNSGTVISRDGSLKAAHPF